MPESSSGHKAASRLLTLAAMSGYGLAIGLSLIAMAVTWLLFPVFGLNVSAIFFLVVILTAWRGGLGPAILTMALSTLILIPLIVSPLGSPGLAAQEVLTVLMFLAVSAVIALISHSLDRARWARDRSLAALRLSEARIEAMTNSIAEATVLLSPDLRVLDVNRPFEELLGIVEEHVRERPFHDLAPLVRQAFADPDRLLAMIADVDPDDDDTYQAFLIQNWPKPRELLVYSAPVLRDDDGHEHFGRLYAFRDITRERQVDRMKTEFVSLVSHELRTPLTSIKGFTDLILDGDAGPINEETSEYLEIVQSNADRLVALVNDLLDISRIESGRIELDIEVLDLNDIVDQVVAVMRPRIEEKEQALSIEIDPKARWVRGDHDKMVQALTNYVSNAYKYTPAGGSIRVQAEQANAFCRLAVKDTGIGVAPDEQAQLFTRFYRVDSSLTAEVGGTGLGLSIVKSIAELQGGWVGVESKPGEGSTFYMTVPLGEGPSSEGAGSVIDEPRPAAAGQAAPSEMLSPAVVQASSERAPLIPSRYTILVVEANPEISRLLCGHLEKAGYVVEQARGAEEALARVAEHLPDLITLDVELPAMEGFELANQLADLPATRNTPILVVTVLDDDADCPQFGVSALPKPVDRQQLLQMVAQVVVEQGRQRVLVIEDDPGTQELLSVALQKRGFEVLLARDGASGLAMAWEQQPGLILLDLRLPGMDGFAVLQALKQDAATAEIPVLTMTASEGLNAGTRAKVLSLGASDFLTKPFDLDMLMQEILIFVQEKE